jgi:hypothetical protein
LHFLRTTDDEDKFLDFAVNRRGKIIYDTEEKMSAEEKNWDRQLNAYGYLADVIDRMAKGHPINRLGELPPWNWARQTAKLAA